MHIAPYLPDHIPQETTLPFTLDPNCRFAYNDGEKIGFGYVHSGYSMGGYRFQTNFYPNGKKYGPQDCSSWIGELTGFRDPFATLHLMMAYRGEENDISTKLKNHFRSVSFSQIQPGQLVLSRYYNRNETPHCEGNGTGGHIGILHKDPEEDTISLLEYNRDMPAIEGFGFRTYPFNATHSFFPAIKENEPFPTIDNDPSKIKPVLFFTTSKQDENPTLDAECFSIYTPSS